MREQQQPFAALVLQVLMGQSGKLERQWAECAQLAGVCLGDSTGDATGAVKGQTTDGSGYLVRTVLAAAAAYDAKEQNSLAEAGRAIGIEAHRRSMSLHTLLKELDLLSVLLLRGAEDVVRKEVTHGTGSDSLRVARYITQATSEFRLAAASSYTQAISDELRERYRTIRHDLRNPLGTIKTAVALLADETMPADARENGRVRAMVVRNTSSLDQMIDQVLGDTAAHLRAFDVPREVPTGADPDRLPSSAREKRDDVSRPRERPDLEPGSF
jgi:signal transduction histidine kinase